MDFLKAERVGNNKYRVLAIPFGGPLAGRDTDEQYFSPKTDIKPDWFDRRPVLFHHGQDSRIKDSSVGRAEELDMDDEGWWVNIWLDRSSRYWQRINELMDAKVMYGSSGTLNYLAKIDHKSGEILSWPYMEQTLTPTPANFFSRLSPAKAIDHFEAAGIDLSPLVRDILSDPNSPQADLGPDLATAVDPATRRRLSGDLASLLERTNRIP
jgi:hypothetical protein